MALSLQQLVDRLQERGMPTVIEGDPAVRIASVNTLADAGPDELGFLANPRYAEQLGTTRAAAVIVGQDAEAPRAMTLLRTAQPYCAVREAIVMIHGFRRHPQWGIHSSAVISPKAQIGKNANIGPYATVEEDAVIGDDVVLYPGCSIGQASRLGNKVTLHPNVVIYAESTIGNNVEIHAGTVIGEDGLGYAPDGEKWAKFPHVGRVIIEDDVEIGANCTIDRAMLGTTVIGRGGKFSDLIAIGHGAKIGENAMFVAQVGLAGSVTVGKNVKMGGQAGVSGHITIGDYVIIGAKAGVAHDVDPKEYVLGQPAIRASDAKRVFSITQKLPDLKQRVKTLETELAEIRDSIASSAVD
jgi:UDP-3-O-[3-hydroxymyristoyl] glucosamine N-acyltransferase